MFQQRKQKALKGTDLHPDKHRPKMWLGDSMLGGELPPVGPEGQGRAPSRSCSGGL